MIIHGIQKLTLVDFPHHPAAILFTGACNFRCPFCQNAALVLNPSSQPVISEEEIFDFLNKRKKMLEGVVVTGGEPTLQKDLIPFFGKLKELGYLVKLDTNGYRPDVLKQAVESGFVDYVAMDIKTSLDEYYLLSGVDNIDVSLIQQSISYLMEDHVDYEFRTTVVGGLHTKENFKKLGFLLAGCKRYFIQKYSDSGDIIDSTCYPPTEEELSQYLEIMKRFVPQAAFHDR